ncbi:chorismate mutase [Clostridium sp. MSJ-4]|uniref:chorismate mutase n=2 Tax=Clostridiaceae TaxID=31979 RepID=A0ABS6EWT5_9CLOT|nr:MULTISPECIES: chorismate mutase [Clostridium]MBU5590687.1 chorismate mutase [Clostridium simiarum]
MIAIRGAITIAKDDEELIKEATIELFQQIIETNNMNKENIISVFFSCTKDITKVYPGKYIREELGLNNVAIMHFNEMEVHSDKYMPLCIRTLVLYECLDGRDTFQSVYLREAKKLRPDLNH